MEVDTGNPTITNINNLCCNSIKNDHNITTKHESPSPSLVLYVSNTNTQPSVTYYNAFPASTQATINTNTTDYHYNQNKQQQKINNNNNKSINLFEPYFQNLYDCNNKDNNIDGYVATVTVANTSPIGNVSSSSYFSSPLTPRSTSRCDSVHSSCSSTDSGVDIVHQCTPPHLIQPPHGSPHHLSPHSTQHHHQQQQQQTDISVPLGWRRLLVNNTIIYIR